MAEHRQDDEHGSLWEKGAARREAASGDTRLYAQMLAEGDADPGAAVDVAEDQAPSGTAGFDSLIRLVGVSKSFGNLQVLDDLSLDFATGKTTVVLGPSGTGKSVLLKHIVGLLRPDRGAVYFRDLRVDQMRESELVDVRKRVGFLFQMGALFDSMTVGENVMFPLKQHTKLSRPEFEDRCCRVLSLVGLDGIQKQMPASLSGGQRKRVALARAIVLEPEVVLYDEPTTGLDPIRADVINELINALQRQLGITSVVVTHDMASAKRVADRMVMLHNGRVIADAEPEEFLESSNELVQRFVNGQADEDDIDEIRKGFREQR